MNTQILEDIGFTNAEIKIYLALLELGTSAADSYDQFFTIMWEAARK